MNLLLVRDVRTPKFTLGTIYHQSRQICYTVEDAIRETKVAGKTCIPPGTYPILITMSNRFKKELPILLGVPNFEGVRIHAGNTSEDTEGCILPGLIRTNEGVLSSRAAMEKLQPMIQAAIDKGEPVNIEIRNA